MTVTKLPLSNSFTSDAFVIFLHIQKTAGITVQTYLRQRFGPSLPRRLFWRLSKDSRLAGDLRVAAQSRKVGDRYFGGHFCFGIHRHLPQPASYMTFLRDPVKRCISLYNYSHDRPDAYYHKAAKGRVLNEFICESGLLELDNGIVRFIAGAEDNLFINRSSPGSVDEEMLETAKRHIDKYFFFVGVQERFDASFLLLSKLLGDDNPRYLRLNSSEPKSSDERVDEETLRELRQRTQMDRRLYEYVDKRLDERLNEAFPDCDEVLERFAETNRAYNARIKPIHNILNFIRPSGFSAG